MEFQRLSECKITANGEYCAYALKFEEVGGKIKLTIQNVSYFIKKEDLIKALEFITK